MNLPSVARLARVFWTVAAVCLAALLFQAGADAARKEPVNPAYRPDSEYAPAFIAALRSTTIAVYPSIVRGADGTSYSVVSQEQIVSRLNKEKLTSAVAAAGAIDPGQLKGQSQLDMFRNDLQGIAAALKKQKRDAPYALVLEILLPPGNQAVFGIHCYIFDAQGNNAFSFLLNSHHKLFVDADLVARDSTESSRTVLTEKATKAGLTALIQQIKRPNLERADKHQGYSITTQKVSALDEQPQRVFVITRLHERLIPVVMHSFKHSLISAFESNGIDAVVKFTASDSDNDSEFAADVEAFAPDVTMHINLDPLLRTRKDGYEAVVGTVFDVSLVNAANGELVWRATGKVDYIRMFGRRYTAHEGIRKEFAWHTTAAIVRAFMADVNGRQSVHIYTVTEDRQLNGQRVD